METHPQHCENNTVMTDQALNTNNYRSDIIEIANQPHNSQDVVSATSDTKPSDYLPTATGNDCDTPHPTVQHITPTSTMLSSAQSPHPPACQNAPADKSSTTYGSKTTVTGCPNFPDFEKTMSHVDNVPPSPYTPVDTPNLCADPESYTLTKNHHACFCLEPGYVDLSSKRIKSCPQCAETGEQIENWSNKPALSRTDSDSVYESLDSCKPTKISEGRPTGLLTLTTGSTVFHPRTVMEDSRNKHFCDVENKFSSSSFHCWDEKSLQDFVDMDGQKVPNLESEETKKAVCDRDREISPTNDASEPIQIPGVQSSDPLPPFTLCKAKMTPQGNAMGVVSLRRDLGPQVCDRLCARLSELRNVYQPMASEEFWDWHYPHKDLDPFLESPEPGDYTTPCLSPPKVTRRHASLPQPSLTKLPEGRKPYRSNSYEPRLPSEQERTVVSSSFEPGSLSEQEGVSLMDYELKTCKQRPVESPSTPMPVMSLFNRSVDFWIMEID